MKARVQRRRGAAIAPVLVCVALVLLISGGLIKQADTLRKESRNQAVRSQSSWLLESGLSRASAKLDADRKYSGETWEITAEELGLAHPATVRIEVKPSDAALRKNQVKVHVEADYPLGLVERRRTSQTIIIDLGPETPGGTS